MLVCVTEKRTKAEIDALAAGLEALKMNEQPLLFELGKPGRKAIDLPACDVPLAENLLPTKYLRTAKAACRKSANWS